MAVAATSWSDVQRAGSGDPFDRLFTQEYARVVGIANRVLADGHEAEDVAQEVFSAFHGKHPPDAPYAAAWLHAAAAHTALNVVRGKRRRIARELADARGWSRMGETAESALDPQERVERAERRAEVRAALSRIAPRNATILALRYGGLSYAEVADALGVPADQVGTLLRRAEIAFRKEMTRVPHQ